MSDSRSSNWPWGPDAAAWSTLWPSVFQWAPQALSQPILPGWTFNINSQNSSAPQTEAEVVQQHSYGRQLGRMADALAVLIAERGPKAPKNEQLTVFSEMKDQIDTIKREAALARVERLRADLALLKAAKSPDYERLRDALREVLDR